MPSQAPRAKLPVAEAAEDDDGVPLRVEMASEDRPDLPLPPGITILIRDNSANRRIR